MVVSTLRKTRVIHPEPEPEAEPAGSTNASAKENVIADLLLNHYQPTTMMDDVRHNLKGVYLAVVLSIAILIPFQAITQAIVYAQKQNEAEKFSIAYLANTLVFAGACLANMVFYTVLENKLRLYMNWVLSDVILRFCIVAAYLAVSKTALSHYVLVVDFFCLCVSLTILWKTLFDDSSLPIMKVIGASIGMAMQFMISAVLSSAYIALSYSGYLRSSMLSQLIVFGAAYPTLNVINIRFVVLYTAKVIVQLCGKKLRVEWEKLYYCSTKLSLSIPVYYVLINIDDPLTFTLSAAFNAVVEIALTFVECTYHTIIKTTVVESFHKSLGILSMNVNKIEDDISYKQYISRLIMYEEFMEGVCVLLSLTVSNLAGIPFPVVVSKAAGLYVVVFFGDLAQKRIFNHYGFYLSRHKLELEWYEVFTIAFYGVSLLCLIPAGYAMFTPSIEVIVILET